MAQENIDIGVANQGDGDTLFDAFTAVQANFTELYGAYPPGDITSVTAGDGLTGGGTSGDVILTLGVDNSTIEINSDAARIKDLGVTTAKLANDAVTYAKLGTEFTTSAAVSALEVDFATAQVFTKTVSANPSAFTFTGALVGMVKDLVVDGNVTVSWPLGTKIVAGTYSGTADNFIQIVVAGTGDYWLSISQAQ
jgi:hypothetical protein